MNKLEDNKKLDDNIEILKMNLDKIIEFIKNNPYNKVTSELIEKIDREIPFWITRKCDKDNKPTSFYITGDILYRACKELEKIGLKEYY